MTRQIGKWCDDWNDWNAGGLISWYSLWFDVISYVLFSHVCSIQFIHCFVLPYTFRCWMWVLRLPEKLPAAPHVWRLGVKPIWRLWRPLLGNGVVVAGWCWLEIFGFPLSVCFVCRCSLIAIIYDVQSLFRRLNVWSSLSYLFQAVIPMEARKTSSFWFPRIWKAFCKESATSSPRAWNIWNPKTSRTSSHFCTTPRFGTEPMPRQASQARWFFDLLFSKKLKSGSQVCQETIQSWSQRCDLCSLLRDQKNKPFVAQD